MARTVTGESAGVFGSYTTIGLPQAGIGVGFATPAQPAVPLTTVTAPNTAPVSATVVIVAGSSVISNVNVNGSSAGTTAGTYTVPALGNIAITYTVASPTWTWSWPAIPLTTVTAANTWPVSATVVVAGGTGTNVAINGVLQGTFAGAYTVPANGGTIALTYSVIPTWTWSWPAMPASTVALVSPVDRTVTVVIAGGTMTAVSVNGQPSGTGAGTYTVPAFGTIAMTYSVAPTWTWTIPAIFTTALNANGTPVSITGVS